MILVAVAVLVVLALVAVLAVAAVRSPRGSWARRGSASGAVVLLGLLGLSFWAVRTPQPQPLEVDRTLTVGVRVDDGQAQVLLGPGCEDVTALEVVLKVQGSPSSDVLELVATGPGVRVDRFGLTPDDYPEGMSSSEPLDDVALDLSRHHSLSVRQERVGAVVLAPVLEGSSAHPQQYWFGEGIGWLSAQEAARGFESGELSGVCDPAPEGTFAG